MVVKRCLHCLLLSTTAVERQKMSTNCTRQ